MREWTETHREGTNMGPIDWEKLDELESACPRRPKTTPEQRAMLRQAAEALEAGKKVTIWSRSGFAQWRITSICLYDGWPFWQLGPAVCYIGPIDRFEWMWGYEVSRIEVK